MTTSKKLCLLAVTSFTSTAAAAPVSVTDVATGFIPSPRSVSFRFENLATDAIGPGSLTVTAVGDFQDSNEFIDVTFDGLSLGRLFDNNVNNDRFDGTVIDNDDGLRAGLPVDGTNDTAVAALTEAELDAALADGVVELGFAISGAVDDLGSFNGTAESLTATLAFDAAPSAVIPEPSSAAIVGIASAGCLALRRRRRRLAR